MEGRFGPDSYLEVTATQQESLYLVKAIAKGGGKAGFAALRICLDQRGVLPGSVSLKSLTLGHLD